MNGMDYDPSKIGAEIDLSGGVVAGMSFHLIVAKDLHY